MVFSKGQSPRPIIRVIFALGSHEALTLIRSLPPRGSELEHDDSNDSENDDNKLKCESIIVKATLVDIWCEVLPPEHVQGYWWRLSRI